MTSLKQLKRNVPRVLDSNEFGFYERLRRVRCDVCNEEIELLYCTLNVCQSCCEAGKCPLDDWCAFKHPKFVGKPLEYRLRMIKELAR